MREISSSLKENLKSCNQLLKQRYNSIKDFGKEELKRLIQSEIGEISISAKESKQDFQAITGVDGSINTLGGNYPHYITLLQSLAKNSIDRKEEIFLDDIFSPLLEADREEILTKATKDKISPAEAADKIKNRELAALEVQAAKNSILNYQPEVILLDGSLIRYRSQATKEWKSLVELALETETILVGIIEEIGSDKIIENLSSKLPKSMRGMYDRELLFGLLKQGEMIKTEGFKTGLKKAFLRSSKDPGVIGIDMLTEQSDQLDKIANLVYDLTPENGRGIPIWIDIVDEQVRISHKMMEALVDEYIDPALKKQLLNTKRSDRVY